MLTQVVQERPLVTNEHKVIMCATYTKEEIKKALFSIPSDYFYRDAWTIVGNEVVKAVLDALQEGKFFKALNTTVITLVPKTKCPKNVVEFRPISCYNTIYKCVIKVLCNRLRQVLPDFIMKNQEGFGHGRFTAYNIMVT